MNVGLILGAGAVVAYYFRDEIAAQFTAPGTAPAITAATTAASTATATGAPPAAAAVAASVAAAATPPSPITAGAAPNSVALQLAGLLQGGIISPGSLINYCKANGAPDVLSLTQTVSQWNWYLTNWQGIPGQALGDDGSPVTAGAYISLLNAWVRNNGGYGA